jgi:hypothetical protein
VLVDSVSLLYIYIVSLSACFVLVNHIIHLVAYMIPSSVLQDEPEGKARKVEVMSYFSVRGFVCEAMSCFSARGFVATNLTNLVVIMFNLHDVKLMFIMLCKI